MEGKKPPCVQPSWPIIIHPHSLSRKTSGYHHHHHHHHHHHKYHHHRQSQLIIMILGKLSTFTPVFMIPLETVQ
jgi:hypothetical protein